MTFQRDPRIDEAKQLPIAQVVDRLEISGLRTNGAERSGPCPICGGRDRFNIHMTTCAFLCRKCGIKGGDTIALVQEVSGVDFRAALDFLLGSEALQISDEERRRRRKKAEQAEARQRREQERYRRRAIEDARKIFFSGLEAHRGVVPAYLKARGIAFEAIPGRKVALRFLLDHPYMKKVDGKFEELHRGPCMLAAIQQPDGKVVAVHQTWVDPKPPHGKARIVFLGEDYPAKLVRGSKKGGAIRLVSPARPEVLVMGEGIETTLSAAVAGVVPGAAYWAGVDLGNMAGKMQRVQGQRYSGKPDLTDTDAFVPPPWVKRLIFIQDGDSDPKATRAKLLSGLQRAMVKNSQCRGQIVHAGTGVDLNDVLVGAGGAS